MEALLHTEVRWLLDMVVNKTEPVVIGLLNADYKRCDDVYK
jgi:hypothetical protein